MKYIGIYSLRKELLITVGILAGILLLPILVTIALAGNGMQTASNAMVSVNNTTHEVVIYDIRGNYVSTITVSTNWPMDGHVTQEFGHPNHPYQNAHSGIDIAGATQSPITTFMTGKVIKTGDNILEGCGAHCVFIDHGHNIVSIYAHMSQHSVSINQIVQPGQIIGFQGEEGWTHGPHLHFEIKVSGILVNPRMFLLGNPRGNESEAA